MEAEMSRTVQVVRSSQGSSTIELLTWMKEIWQIYVFIPLFLFQTRTSEPRLRKMHTCRWLKCSLELNCWIEPGGRLKRSQLPASTNLRVSANSGGGKKIKSLRRFQKSHAIRARTASSSVFFLGFLESPVRLHFVSHPRNSLKLAEYIKHATDKII